MPETTDVRMAAVQLEATVGNREATVDRALSLAESALADGADVVALPEFFTTRIVFDERVWSAVEPPEPSTVERLEELAADHDATIGGSILARRGPDVYNTYWVVGPDGVAGTHDKDIPTMWENAFYVGGSDDGVVETAHGTTGVAVCWELIRQQTLDRLAGRIQYALTGNHWWTLPDNWPLVDRVLGSVRQYNRYLAENAPVEFARELGVPVVHAAHCGSFEGRFLTYPGDERGLPYRSSYVGATQIVDGDGTVLARRDVDEGPGVVAATVEVPDSPPTDVPAARSSPDRFWVPNLTVPHRLYWHHQNACGRAYYRANRDDRLAAHGVLPDDRSRSR